MANVCFFLAVCFEMFSEMSPCCGLVVAYLALDLSSALFSGHLNLPSLRILFHNKGKDSFSVTVYIAPVSIHKHNKHMYPTRTLFATYLQ